MSAETVIDVPKPAAFGSDLPLWPQVDFSEFGEVESKPLSRVQKLTAQYMSRNWVMIPHVTHNDEADITALELQRKARNAAGEAIKLTLLPYLIKAVVAALKAFPQFNASLDGSGKNLVLKKYFHIGVAVDTRFGLLVPVLRDCDKKSLAQIAAELHSISTQARDKGLSMAQMSGGCFTISSLGSFGGTSFTPIVNAPEVAILGVTRADDKPRRGANDAIDWRLTLPLSLSYDHRVINGADAARFTAKLAQLLADVAALES
ncbi:pyruvate dehydrogenase E2 component (dihydrolipoamide acetyltransferase) [Pseudomonas sp. SJZ103]|uniref:2-oxo acid dehydrogenase subunit E2 n=1 Tax=unclassified Pseudomonas TaxID=196821 RepID=UPI0011A8A904|nr:MULTISPECIES: 2-oxo acid dehydrogenase subunit E2 [unclassified Pseudomonas]MBB6290721.1 pyruvate dehydrogenase E2 component (dihydrolipoamide acetyltransferase) [Pseudomonas sp. SJZ073]MBB6315551.1 pyruvate dehydrogenase E2 component (dihydrolipoamide acetyltransferase) [Pseudomonas sp. JAI120]TWC61572.1 pyruvate dehydrogenase E2 component (dihydrolipoamide acetyltransferase) [Pseudomonas sp. SJZ103]TWC78768.1 pyruvate dehydrogenase E2 component (dihydrolipoamide acetyltransferase) [Pseudom